MQFVKTNSNYIIRLEKGEEIIETLKSFCESEKINTAFFNAIGAALSAEIAYYDLPNKKYLTKELNSPHEIVSLNGNVTIVDEKPFVHAHGVFSNENLECKGGHLKEGVVGATCEIFLTKQDIELKREFDPEIGLKLLDCKY